MRAPPYCSPRSRSEIWCVAFARCVSDPKPVLPVNAVDVDASVGPPDPARDIAVQRRRNQVRCGICWTGRALQDAIAIAIARDSVESSRRSATVRRPGVAAPRGGRPHVTRSRSARRQPRARARTNAALTMRRDEARWCRAPRDRSTTGDHVRIRRAACRRVAGPSIRPVRPRRCPPDPRSVSIIRPCQPRDPAPHARAGRSGGLNVRRRRGGVVPYPVRRVGVSSGARPGQRGEPV